MADISVADIKRVREVTGAGMSDVKAALVAANGDQQVAIDELRKKGAAKAMKRGAERVASNGIVAAADGAMLELACETDFVAKNELVLQLASDVVAHVARTGTADIHALLDEKLASGETVAQGIDHLAAAMGEKMEIRRVVHFDGQVATYLHRRASDLPPQIGVLVEFVGSDAEAARGVAMQVASLGALYLTRDDVPVELVAKEREIAESVARDEGKPEAALPKIVEGRVQGFYKDVVLVEQPSIRDNKKSVQKVVEDAGLVLTRFARFEVGKA